MHLKLTVFSPDIVETISTFVLSEPNIRLMDADDPLVIEVTLALKNPLLIPVGILASSVIILPAKMIPKQRYILNRGERENAANIPLTKKLSLTYYFDKKIK